MDLALVIVVALLFQITKLVGGDEVTYDGRSLIIDGRRNILFSGSIHYPRSTPEMWPSLISKAKEGGLDVIQTYVFWNLHEPQPSQYDFSGRNDLVKFIKEIQAQGLYVCLRIGPYIESEWTYGGFPFWLHDVPGIVFRTDNKPFKFYMQNFTAKIVNLMKSEGLYASQGGPIILSQIENEYGNVEAAFNESGPAYVRWAANMSLNLQTGVPWIMCKQPDAPDPVINTCNGMKCGETFGGPNSPNKPSLWTENWTSFYQVYGGEPYIRSAQDIAFHVALFIAKNGSYINYYMYHGGTNFGRTAASYFITSYYDQAPLDEYGLVWLPKWGHLKELHAAIKNCSTSLLEGVQSNFSLGQFQQAYIFEQVEESRCTAFLVNNDTANNGTVEFRNMTFQLLPKSITILSDCQNVIFNTAQVNYKEMTRTMQISQALDEVGSWDEFKDIIPQFGDTNLQANALLDHMNITKNKSDYLWYSISVDPTPSCAQPLLRVESHGHVVHAFVNNNYAGSEHGSHNTKVFTMETPINLTDEIMNNISILSIMVGLPDSGPFLESKFIGLSKVEIQCSDEGYSLDLTTNYTWGYQVGLFGEKLEIYEEKNLGNVEWVTSNVDDITKQPLTWYKTVFDAPIGDDPVTLNLSKMGKGEVWVNGQSIGRYWISFLTPKGIPSQTMYHVPRSFLKSDGNLLVIMEELDGKPFEISLHTVSITNYEPDHHATYI